MSLFIFNNQNIQTKNYILTSAELSSHFYKLELNSAQLIIINSVGEGRGYPFKRQSSSHSNNNDILIDRMLSV